MRPKDPFFELDWSSWGLAVFVHRYLHWTRSVRIYDLAFMVGPFTFGFAIWGREK